MWNFSKVEEAFHCVPNLKFYQFLLLVRVIIWDRILICGLGLDSAKYYIGAQQWGLSPDLAIPSTYKKKQQMDTDLEEEKKEQCGTRWDDSAS